MMTSLFVSERDPFDALGDMPIDGISPEFRIRLLESHRDIQAALLQEGGRFAVGQALTADRRNPAASEALEIRDQDDQTAAVAVIELQLENARRIEISYRRSALRGIPSDILVWELIRDLERECA